MKAIVAAVAGGLVAAIAVLVGGLDASETFADVTASEWLQALSAFLIGAGLTGGATWLSPRNKYKGEHVEAPSGP